MAAVAKERGGEKSRLWSLSLRNGLVLDVGRGEGTTSFPPFTSTHTYTHKTNGWPQPRKERKRERELSAISAVSLPPPSPFQPSSVVISYLANPILFPLESGRVVVVEEEEEEEVGRGAIH